MPVQLITHSGPFHTDDVFATALLLHFFPDAKVIRTREEAVIATGDIVYDVGKQYSPSNARFDHHQTGASRRQNNIIYSSLGLLWKEYGIDYCDGNSDVAALIERKFIVPIDANDNGQAITEPLYEDIRPFTIDDVIRIYNPLVWLNDTEEPDVQFNEALSLAKLILTRLRDYAQDTIIAEKLLVERYAKAADKRILEFDKPVSADNVIAQCPELLYVIFPRPEGTWSAFAVRKSSGTYQSRLPFPEAWRALDTSGLVSMTGVDDVIFCHATGFLAVARSRAGAHALAQASIAAPR